MSQDLRQHSSTRDGPTPLYSVKYSEILYKGISLYHGHRAVSTQLKSSLQEGKGTWNINKMSPF